MRPTHIKMTTHCQLSPQPVTFPPGKQHWFRPDYTTVSVGPTSRWQHNTVASLSWQRDCVLYCNTCSRLQSTFNLCAYSKSAARRCTFTLQGTIKTPTFSHYKYMKGIAVEWSCDHCEVSVFSDTAQSPRHLKLRSTVMTVQRRQAHILTGVYHKVRQESKTICFFWTIKIES